MERQICIVDEHESLKFGAGRCYWDFLLRELLPRSRPIKHCTRGTYILLKFIGQLLIHGLSLPTQHQEQQQPTYNCDTTPESHLMLATPHVDHDLNLDCL